MNQSIHSRNYSHLFVFRRKEKGAKIRSQNVIQSGKLMARRTAKCVAVSEINVDGEKERTRRGAQRANSLSNGMGRRDKGRLAKGVSEVFSA